MTEPTEPYEPHPDYGETTDEYLGRTIRVCHKTARIVECNRRSYEAEIELGGVTQHVVLSDEYVHERIDSKITHTECPTCGDDTVRRVRDGVVECVSCRTPLKDDWCDDGLLTDE